MAIMQGSVTLLFSKLLPTLSCYAPPTLGLHPPHWIAHPVFGSYTWRNIVVVHEMGDLCIARHSGLFPSKVVVYKR